MANEMSTPFDRHDDGRVEEAFFNFNLEPLRGERGAVVGMMGVAVEVTEQVRARRRSEEAVAARDEFISIATHELRSPLTTMRLQVDSLLRMANASDLSGERVASKLGVIRRQLDRADALIADLVDVTRITGNRLELRRERVDLGQVTREVVERLGEELARAGCEVTVAIEPELVGEWDLLRVDQVITNLLSNAAKYGQGKLVAIAASRDGSSVRWTITDQGVGIPAEEHERIFERFERASTGRRFGGLGLGLWIARHIVAAMGGTIRLRSEVGKGSTFEMELPI